MKYVYQCNNKKCNKVYPASLRYHRMLKNSRDIDTNYCGACYPKGELVYSARLTKAYNKA